MNIPTLITAASALLISLAAPVAATSAELPSAVKDALTAALNDEYHAEAFYAAIIDKHGAVRPFSNIIEAERMHAAMLRGLMTTYGMPAPDNSQLGKAEIVALVPDTVDAACEIGVKAEIDNAALYDDKLIPAAAAYPDIVLVFENLRDASQERHLRAFKRCGGR